MHWPWMICYRMALAMIFTLTLCATFLTREINAIPPKPCPDCICAIEAKMEDITANALFPAGFPKHFRKPPTDCSSSNPNCKCVEVDPVTECEVQSGKAVAKPGEKVNEINICRQLSKINA